MNKKIYTFLTMLFVLSQSLLAQQAGSSTYRFLLMPNSPRLAAMGGVMYNKYDEDFSLSLHNPSLLQEDMSKQILLSFIDYPSDISAISAAYAHKFEKIGMLSASINYLNYGKFLEVDEMGNEYGNFSAQDFYTQISWGRELDTNLYIGASLKLINSKYYNYSSFGVAADVATTYVIPHKRISMSLLAQNMGRQIVTYAGSRENLPFSINAAFSQKLKHAPFTYSVVWQNLTNWDLTFKDPNDPTIQRDAITGEIIEKTNAGKFVDKTLRHLVVGVEFQPLKAFSLRMAYNYQRRQELKLPTRPALSGFSWGFGIRISKFHFNYSRSIYNPAGSPNHISISTRISDFVK